MIAKKLNLKNICEILIEYGASIEITIDSNKKLSKKNNGKKGNEFKDTEKIINKSIAENDTMNIENDKKEINKKKDDKKNKKNKIKEDDNLNKIDNNNKKVGNSNNKKELIKDECEDWKMKKYVLVKVENGQNIPLSNEEMEIFIKNNEDIYSLLTDSKKRTRLRRNLRYQKNYMNSNNITNNFSWEKQAEKLMNMLWKVKNADLFHKPVDPIELNIPDYFKVITKPMDFSKINEKLKLGQYQNLQQFENDINLTFDNCHLYNGETSYVGKMCTDVKKNYLKFYNQLKMDQFK